MRQKIVHGATIDAATMEEIETLFASPEPGMQGRENGYSGLFDVVMGDFDHPESVLLVSPPARRLRITRHAHGGDAITATTTPQQLVTVNEGRMALQIVNYGSNPVILYLTNVDDLIAGGSGAGAIWLNSGGGSWDGEFAEGLWGGNVCTKTLTGTTTLTLVEI